MAKEGMNIEGSLQNRGIDHRSVFNQDMGDAMQRLGHQFDVEVEVIAKAGDPYIAGTQIVVPSGCEFLRIRSQRRDLSDFWQNVDKLADRLSHERQFRVAESRLHKLG